MTQQPTVNLAAFRAAMEKSRPAVQAMVDHFSAIWRQIKRGWSFQMSIRYAQARVWASETLPDGPTRHRAVKAARDELRHLRKLELRIRGWK